MSNISIPTPQQFKDNVQGIAPAVTQFNVVGPKDDSVGTFLRSFQIAENSRLQAERFRLSRQQLRFREGQQLENARAAALDSIIKSTTETFDELNLKDNLRDNAVRAKIQGLSTQAIAGANTAIANKDLSSLNNGVARFQLNLLNDEEYIKNREINQVFDTFAKNKGKIKNLDPIAYEDAVQHFLDYKNSYEVEFDDSKFNLNNLTYNQDMVDDVLKQYTEKARVGKKETTFPIIGGFRHKKEVITPKDKTALVSGLTDALLQTKDGRGYLAAKGIPFGEGHSLYEPITDDQGNVISQGTRQKVESLLGAFIDPFLPEEETSFSAGSPLSKESKKTLGLDVDEDEKSQTFRIDGFDIEVGTLTQNRIVTDPDTGEKYIAVRDRDIADRIDADLKLELEDTGESLLGKTQDAIFDSQTTNERYSTKTFGKNLAAKTINDKFNLTGENRFGEKGDEISLIKLTKEQANSVGENKTNKNPPEAIISNIVKTLRDSAEGVPSSQGNLIITEGEKEGTFTIFDGDTIKSKNIDISKLTEAQLNNLNTLFFNK